MPDHKTIYGEYADNYNALVSREDHTGNILRAIRKVIPIDGIDVVELGAGTGRLTCLLTPHVKSIKALDSSDHMLGIARDRLSAAGWHNWQTQVADHRSLPVDSNSADLALSGWSICYLVDWSNGDWKADVEKALSEMERVLKPGGTLLIIETQGTGFESPNPPEHLIEYFRFLKDQGFSSTWFRTDYQFADLAEAKELTGFFFGEALASQTTSTILTECTGLWWKKKAV